MFRQLVFLAFASVGFAQILPPMTPKVNGSEYWYGTRVQPSGTSTRDNVVEFYRNGTSGQLNCLFHENAMTSTCSTYNTGCPCDPSTLVYTDSFISFYAYSPSSVGVGTPVFVFNSTFRSGGIMNGTNSQNGGTARPFNFTQSAEVWDAGEFQVGFEPVGSTGAFNASYQDNFNCSNVCAATLSIYNLTTISFSIGAASYDLLKLNGSASGTCFGTGCASSSVNIRSVFRGFLSSYRASFPPTPSPTSAPTLPPGQTRAPTSAPTTSAPTTSAPTAVPTGASTSAPTMATTPVVTSVSSLFQVEVALIAILMAVAVIV